MDDFVFGKEDLGKTLNNYVSDNKCPRPDQIHPRALHECSKELSLTLYLILGRHQTLESSLEIEIPRESFSNFKKGSRTKPV